MPNPSPRAPGSLTLFVLGVTLFRLCERLAPRQPSASNWSWQSLECQRELFAWPAPALHLQCDMTGWKL